MPSWLSPRIGAVPQAGQPADRKKKDRRSKQQQPPAAAPKKGITMEDLKKQTAIRLALEQKKRPTETPSKGPFSSPPPNAGPIRNAPGPPTLPTNSVYPLQQAPVPYRYDLPPPTMPQMVSQPSYDAPFAPTNPSLHHLPHSYSTMPPEIIDPAFSVDEEQEEDDELNTLKLPHGLTVQELKEMTKARLRAEAAKKERSAIAKERRGQATVSPLPLAVPVPLVQSRSRTHSREGWSQECSRGDTDEYSVCSTTSDFPGSESVFGTGPSPSPSPFAPNRAYHGSYGGPSPADNYTMSPLNDTVAASAYGSSGDYFNPNRRRAQTMSPRQGFSHLDEDRQVLPDPDFPGMPSFSSPPTNRHYPRFSNGSSADMFTGFPARPNMVDPNSRAQTLSLGPTSTSERGLNNADWMENRPRTSSAASLPAMSHTAEEFFLMEPLQYQRSSFQPLSDIGVLDEEDAPQPAVTGLADVFRKSPPPGFDTSSTSLRGLDVLGSNAAAPSYASSGDVRNRASTWAPDSIFGSSSSPPSVGFGMEELAAILKLSEEEESLQR